MSPLSQVIITILVWKSEHFHCKVCHSSETQERHQFSRIFIFSIQKQRLSNKELFLVKSEFPQSFIVLDSGLPKLVIGRKLNQNVLKQEGDSEDGVIYGISKVNNKRDLLLADYYNRKVKLFIQQEGNIKVLYTSQFYISKVNLLQNGTGLLTYEITETECAFLKF